MFDGQISAELEARLAGKVRGIPVGAGKLHGMKMGERSSALDPKFTAASRSIFGQEGRRSGVFLVWNNPTAMRKRASNKAPLLMVVR